MKRVKYTDGEIKYHGDGFVIGKNYRLPWSNNPRCQSGEVHEGWSVCVNAPGQQCRKTFRTLAEARDYVRSAGLD